MRSDKPQGGPRAVHDQSYGAIQTSNVDSLLLFESDLERSGNSVSSSLKEKGTVGTLDIGEEVVGKVRKILEILDLERRSGSFRKSICAKDQGGEEKNRPVHLATLRGWSSA